VALFFPEFWGPGQGNRGPWGPHRGSSTCTVLAFFVGPTQVCLGVGTIGGDGFFSCGQRSCGQGCVAYLPNKQKTTTPGSRRGTVAYTPTGGGAPPRSHWAETQDHFLAQKGNIRGPLAWVVALGASYLCITFTRNIYREEGNRVFYASLKLRWDALLHRQTSFFSSKHDSGTRGTSTTV